MPQPQRLVALLGVHHLALGQRLHLDGLAFAVDVDDALLRGATDDDRGVAVRGVVLLDRVVGRMRQRPDLGGTSCGGLGGRRQRAVRGDGERGEGVEELIEAGHGYSSSLPRCHSRTASSDILTKFANVTVSTIFATLAFR